LIVVDEEHDTSYKQEDGVLYQRPRHGRAARGDLRGGGGAGLGHAQPGNLGQCEAGKYARLDLGRRFGAADMPD
jgi:primosomal protein N' (replication factor Y) (superfamily II helicase)